MVKHAASTIAKITTPLAVWGRRLIAARKRRHEYQREFYRDLDEYRRTHGLSFVDPEDWKFWFHEIDKRTH